MPNFILYPYKFFCLSHKQRLLLFEAFFFLLLAKISLNLLPFKSLFKFLNRASKKDQLHGTVRELQRNNIVWAINCITNRFPLNFVCFPRGISVFLMLARRGILTSLFYGVARLPAKELSAHVWVMDGEKGVVGHEISHDYVILFSVPTIRFKNTRAVPHS